MTYWPFWVGGIGLFVVAMVNRLVVGKDLGVTSAITAALTPAMSDRRSDEALNSCAGTPLPDRALWLEPRALSYIAFLLCIAVGGFLGRVVGVWEQGGDISATLQSYLSTSGAIVGSRFSALFGDNVTWSLAVLFFGGLLVGFGTRLAGGCTSGHGLSGCGRLRGSSILSTATFFGTAIVVSLVLKWIFVGGSAS